jgi:transcriptional regulator with XRE-family HTH domain
MPTHQDPSFYRRRVREILRKARETSGLTQRQAAIALDWSMSKLVRIEAGTVGVSTTDLRAMLQLYKISDEGEAKDLIEMTRAARRRPWFSKYQNVLSPAFAQYLGYESSASVIRGFQPLTIPGLFQTDDYARAILEVRRATRIDERVALRVARQELLDRDDCPDIFYIIDEAALHREVGGPVAMRRQLRYLIEIIKSHKITLQIVPFSAGAHTSMSGPFTILEFSNFDEDVLYLETAGGSVTSREDQDRVSEYRENFDLLSEQALGKDKAEELIEGLIRRFMGNEQ